MPSAPRALRLPLALLFLAAASVACLFTASTAHAARGMEIAVQDDGQFLNADAGRRIAAFEHARALGASSLRVNVPWASIAPTPTAPSRRSRPCTTSAASTAWSTRRPRTASRSS